jgi:solute carrier family 41
MKQVDQLIMIIPVILNLKGNLEMNLSARLGTAANVGELDNSEARRTIIFGNLLLLQVQATVVSFVAACVSLILGRIVPRSRLPSAEANASKSKDMPMLLLRQIFSLDSRHPRPYIPPTDGARKSGIREFVFPIRLIYILSS